MIALFGLMDICLGFFMDLLLHGHFSYVLMRDVFLLEPIVLFFSVHSLVDISLRKFLPFLLDYPNFFNQLLL